MNSEFAPDAEKILLMFAHTRGSAGFSEDEVDALSDWYDRVVTEANMLLAVEGGWMAIDWKDGEPAYSITEKGIQRVEAMRGTVTERAQNGDK